MIIYLSQQGGTLNKIKRSLEKTNFFSTVAELQDNKLIMITKKIVTSSNDDLFKIQKKLLQVAPTAQFSFHPDPDDHVSKKKEDKIENKKKRFHHIFFDIDSTLTENHVDTIDWRVRSWFKKFQEQDCLLYFCSGRAYQDIGKLTTSYGLGYYGIAENGGIILGIGHESTGYKYGNISEPNKLLQYLNGNGVPFKIDAKQSNRKTEVVLVLKSISESVLKKAIAKSGANVEYTKSARAYHITKEKVNKGTAINYLIGTELELDRGLVKIVGMGDSGLDAKMFCTCDEGYVVKSGTDEAKNSVPKYNWLKKNPPHAIEELYHRLFRYG